MCSSEEYSYQTRCLTREQYLDKEEMSNGASFAYTSQKRRMEQMVAYIQASHSVQKTEQHFSRPNNATLSCIICECNSFQHNSGRVHLHLFTGRDT
jgi:hypothetical protein